MPALLRDQIVSQHQQSGGLIKELVYKCLFEIPTIDQHGADAPPKCKSHETRDAAFKLLVELARECPENFAELADLLMTQHEGGTCCSLFFVACFPFLTCSLCVPLRPPSNAHRPLSGRMEVLAIGI